MNDKPQTMAERIAAAKARKADARKAVHQNAMADRRYVAQLNKARRNSK